MFRKLLSKATTSRTDTEVDVGPPDYTHLTPAEATIFANDECRRLLDVDSDADAAPILQRALAAVKVAHTQPLPLSSGVHGTGVSRTKGKEGEHAAPSSDNFGPSQFSRGDTGTGSRGGPTARGNALGTPTNVSGRNTPLSRVDSGLPPAHGSSAHAANDASAVNYSRLSAGLTGAQTDAKTSRRCMTNPASVLEGIDARTALVPPAPVLDLDSYDGVLYALAVFKDDPAVGRDATSVLLAELQHEDRHRRRQWAALAGTVAGACEANAIAEQVQFLSQTRGDSSASASGGTRFEDAASITPRRQTIEGAGTVDEPTARNPAAASNVVTDQTPDLSSIFGFAVGSVDTAHPEHQQLAAQIAVLAQSAAAYGLFASDAASASRNLLDAIAADPDKFFSAMSSSDFWTRMNVLDSAFILAVHSPDLLTPALEKSAQLSSLISCLALKDEEADGQEVLLQMKALGVIHALLANPATAISSTGGTRPNVVDAAGAGDPQQTPGSLRSGAMFSPQDSHIAGQQPLAHSLSQLGLMASVAGGNAGATNAATTSLLAPLWALSSASTSGAALAASVARRRHTASDQLRMRLVYEGLTTNVLTIAESKGAMAAAAVENAIAEMDDMARQATIPTSNGAAGPPGLHRKSTTSSAVVPPVAAQRIVSHDDEAATAAGQQADSALAHVRPFSRTTTGATTSVLSAASSTGFRNGGEGADIAAGAGSAGHVVGAVGNGGSPFSPVGRLNPETQANLDDTLLCAETITRSLLGSVQTQKYFRDVDKIGRLHSFMIASASMSIVNAVPKDWSGESPEPIASMAKNPRTVQRLLSAVRRSPFHSPTQRGIVVAGVAACCALIASSSNVPTSNGGATSSSGAMGGGSRAPAAGSAALSAILESDEDEDPLDVLSDPDQLPSTTERGASSGFDSLLPKKNKGKEGRAVDRSHTEVAAAIEEGEKEQASTTQAQHSATSALTRLAMDLGLAGSHIPAGPSGVPTSSGAAGGASGSLKTTDAQKKLLPALARTVIHATGILRACAVLDQAIAFERFEDAAHVPGASSSRQRPRPKSTSKNDDANDDETNGSVSAPQERSAVALLSEEFVTQDGKRFVDPSIPFSSPFTETATAAMQVCDGALSVIAALAPCHSSVLENVLSEMPGERGRPAAFAAAISLLLRFCATQTHSLFLTDDERAENARKLRGAWAARVANEENVAANDNTQNEGDEDTLSLRTPTRRSGTDRDDIDEGTPADVKSFEDSTPRGPPQQLTSERLRDLVRSHTKASSTAKKNRPPETSPKLRQSKTGGKEDRGDEEDSCSSLGRSDGGGESDDASFDLDDDEAIFADSPSATFGTELVSPWAKVTDFSALVARLRSLSAISRALPLSAVGAAVSFDEANNATTHVSCLCGGYVAVLEQISKIPRGVRVPLALASFWESAYSASWRAQISDATNASDAVTKSTDAATAANAQRGTTVANAKGSITGATEKATANVGFMTDALESLVMAYLVSALNPSVAATGSTVVSATMTSTSTPAVSGVRQPAALVPLAASKAEKKSHGAKSETPATPVDPSSSGLVSVFTPQMSLMAVESVLGETLSQLPAGVPQVVMAVPPASQLVASLPSASVLISEEDAVEFAVACAQVASRLGKSHAVSGWPSIPNAVLPTSATPAGAADGSPQAAALQRSRSLSPSTTMKRHSVGGLGGVGLGGTGLGGAPPAASPVPVGVSGRAASSPPRGGAGQTFGGANNASFRDDPTVSAVRRRRRGARGGVAELEVDAKLCHHSLAVQVPLVALCELFTCVVVLAKQHQQQFAKEVEERRRNAEAHAGTSHLRSHSHRGQHKKQQDDDEGTNDKDQEVDGDDDDEYCIATDADLITDADALSRTQFARIVRTLLRAAVHDVSIALVSLPGNSVLCREARKSLATCAQLASAARGDAFTASAHSEPDAGDKHRQQSQQISKDTGDHSNVLAFATRQKSAVEGSGAESRKAAVSTRSICLPEFTATATEEWCRALQALSAASAATTTSQPSASAAALDSNMNVTSSRRSSMDGATRGQQSAHLSSHGSMRGLGGKGGGASIAGTSVKDREQQHLAEVAKTQQMLSSIATISVPELADMSAIALRCSTVLERAMVLSAIASAVEVSKRAVFPDSHPQAPSSTTGGTAPAKVNGVCAFFFPKLSVPAECQLTTRTLREFNDRRTVEASVVAHVHGSTEDERHIHSDEDADEVPTFDGYGRRRSSGVRMTPSHASSPSNVTLPVAANSLGAATLLLLIPLASNSSSVSLGLTTTTAELTSGGGALRSTARRPSMVGFGASVSASMLMGGSRVVAPIAGGSPVRQMPSTSLRSPLSRGVSAIASAGRRHSSVQGPGSPVMMAAAGSLVFSPFAAGHGAVDQWLPLQHAFETVTAMNALAIAREKKRRMFAREESQLTTGFSRLGSTLVAAPPPVPKVPSQPELVGAQADHDSGKQVPSPQLGPSGLPFAPTPSGSRSSISPAQVSPQLPPQGGAGGPVSPGGGMQPIPFGVSSTIDRVPSSSSLQASMQAQGQGGGFSAADSGGRSVSPAVLSTSSLDPEEQRQLLDRANLNPLTLDQSLGGFSGPFGAESAKAGAAAGIDNSFDGTPLTAPRGATAQLTAGAALNSKRALEEDVIRGETSSSSSSSSSENDGDDQSDQNDNDGDGGAPRGGERSAFARSQSKRRASLLQRQSSILPPLSPLPPPGVAIGGLDGAPPPTPLRVPGPDDSADHPRDENDADGAQGKKEKKKKLTKSEKKNVVAKPSHARPSLTARVVAAASPSTAKAMLAALADATETRHSWADLRQRERQIADAAKRNIAEAAAREQELMQQQLKDAEDRAKAAVQREADEAARKQEDLERQLKEAEEKARAAEAEAAEHARIAAEKEAAEKAAAEEAARQHEEEAARKQQELEQALKDAQEKAEADAAERARIAAEQEAEKQAAEEAAAAEAARKQEELEQQLHDAEEKARIAAENEAAEKAAAEEAEEAALRQKAELQQALKDAEEKAAADREAAAAAAERAQEKAEKEAADAAAREAEQQEAAQKQRELEDALRAAEETAEAERIAAAAAAEKQRELEEALAAKVEAEIADQQAAADEAASRQRAADQEKLAEAAQKQQALEEALLAAEERAHAKELAEQKLIDDQKALEAALREAEERADAAARQLEEERENSRAIQEGRNKARALSGGTSEPPEALLDDSESGSDAHRQQQTQQRHQTQHGPPEFSSTGLPMDEEMDDAAATRRSLDAFRFGEEPTVATGVDDAHDEDELAKLRRQLAEALEQLAAAEAARNALQEATATLQATVEDVTVREAAACEDRDNIAERLQEVEASRESAANDVAEAQATIDDLQSQLDSVQAREASSVDRAELDDLHRKLEEAQALFAEEKAELEQKVESAVDAAVKKSHATLSEARDALEKAEHDAAQTAADLDVATAALAEKEDYLAEVQAALDTANEHVSTTKDALAAANDATAESEAKLIDANEKLSQMASDATAKEAVHECAMSALEAANADVVSRVTELEAAKAVSDLEVAAWTAQLKAAVKAAEAKGEATAHELATTIEQLEAAKTDNEASQTRNSELVQQLSAATENCVSKSAAVEALKEEMEALRTRAASDEDERTAAAEAKIAQLADDLAAEKELNADVNERNSTLHFEFEMAQESLRCAEAATTESRADADSARAAQAAAHEAKYELEGAIADLESQLQASRDDAASRAQTHDDELKKAHDAIAAKTAEMDRLKVELEMVEETANAKVAGHTEAKEKDAAEAASTIEGLQAELAKAKEDLAQLGEEFTTAKAEHADRVESLEADITAGTAAAAELSEKIDNVMEERDRIAVELTEAQAAAEAKGTEARVQLEVAEAQLAEANATIASEKSANDDAIRTFITQIVEATAAAEEARSNATAAKEALVARTEEVDTLTSEKAGVTEALQQQKEQAERTAALFERQQEELSSLRAHIDDQTAEMDAARSQHDADIAALKAEHEAAIEKDVAAHESAVEDRDRDVERLRGEVAAKEATIEDLKKDDDGKSAAIDAMRTALADAEADNAILQRAVHDGDVALAEFARDGGEKADLLKAAQEELTAAQDEAARKDQIIDQNAVEIADLRASVEEKDDALKETRQDLALEVAESSAKAAMLQRVMDNLEADERRLAETTSEITDLHAQIETLSAENSALKTTVDEADSKTADLETAVNRLEEEAAAKDESIAVSAAETARLTEALEAAQRSADENSASAVDAVAALEREVELLQHEASAKNDEHQSSIAELNSAVDNLKADLASAQKDATDSKAAAIGAVSTYEAAIIGLQNLVEKKDAQLEDATALLADEKVAAAAASESSAAAMEKWQLLERENEALKASRDDAANEHTATVAALEDELETMKSSSVADKAAMEELTGRVSDLAAELEEAKNRGNAATDEQAAMIASLERQLAVLKSTDESDNASLEDLRARIAELEETVSDQEKDLALKDKTIVDMTAELEAKDSAEEDLEAEIAAAKQKIDLKDRVLDSLSEKIETLEQQLSDAEDKLAAAEVKTSLAEAAAESAASNNAELAAAVDTVKFETKRVEKDRDDLQDAITVQEAELGRLEDESVTLKARIAELADRCGTMEAKNSDLQEIIADKTLNESDLERKLHAALDRIPLHHHQGEGGRDSLTAGSTDPLEKEAITAESDFSDDDGAGGDQSDVDNLDREKDHHCGHESRDRANADEAFTAEAVDDAAPPNAATIIDGADGARHGMSSDDALHEIEELQRQLALTTDDLKTARQNEATLQDIIQSNDEEKQRLVTAKDALTADSERANDIISAIVRQLDRSTPSPAGPSPRAGASDSPIDEGDAEGDSTNASMLSTIDKDRTVASIATLQQLLSQVRQDVVDYARRLEAEKSQRQADLHASKEESEQLIRERDAEQQLRTQSEDALFHSEKALENAVAAAEAAKANSAQLEQTLADLRSSPSALNRDGSQADDQVTILAEVESRLAEAQAEKCVLEEKLAAAIHASETLATERQIDEDAHTRKVEQLTAAFEDAKTERDTDAAAAEARITQLTDALVTAETMLEEGDKVKADQDAAIRQLKSQLDDAATALSAATTAHEDTISVKKLQQDLDEAVTALDIARAAANADSDSAEKIADLQAAIESLTEQRITVAGTVETLQSKLDGEIATNAEKSALLEEALTAKRSETDRAEAADAQAAALEATVQELTAANDQKSAAATDLQSRLIDLDAALATATQMREELQKEVDDAKARRDEAEDDCAHKDAQISEMQRVVDDAMAAASLAEEKSVKTEATIAALEQQKNEAMSAQAAALEAKASAADEKSAAVARCVALEAEAADAMRARDLAIEEKSAAVAEQEATAAELEKKVDESDALIAANANLEYDAEQAQAARSTLEAELSALQSRYDEAVADLPLLKNALVLAESERDAERVANINNHSDAVADLTLALQDKGREVAKLEEEKREMAWALRDAMDGKEQSTAAEEALRTEIDTIKSSLGLELDDAKRAAESAFVERDEQMHRADGMEEDNKRIVEYVRKCEADIAALGADLTAAREDAADTAERLAVTRAELEDERLSHSAEIEQLLTKQRDADRVQADSELAMLKRDLDGTAGEKTSRMAEQYQKDAAAMVKTEREKNMKEMEDVFAALGRYQRMMEQAVSLNATTTSASVPTDSGQRRGNGDNDGAPTGSEPDEGSIGDAHDRNSQTAATSGPGPAAAGGSDANDKSKANTVRSPVGTAEVSNHDAVDATATTGGAAVSHDLMPRHDALASPDHRRTMAVLREAESVLAVSELQGRRSGSSPRLDTTDESLVLTHRLDETQRPIPSHHHDHHRLSERSPSERRRLLHEAAVYSGTAGSGYGGGDHGYSPQEQVYDHAHGSAPRSHHHQDVMGTRGAGDATSRHQNTVTSSMSRPQLYPSSVPEWSPAQNHEGGARSTSTPRRGLSQERQPSRQEEEEVGREGSPGWAVLPPLGSTPLSRDPLHTVDLPAWTTPSPHRPPPPVPRESKDFSPKLAWADEY